MITKTLFALTLLSTCPSEVCAIPGKEEIEREFSAFTCEISTRTYSDASIQCLTAQITKIAKMWSCLKIEMDKLASGPIKKALELKKLRLKAIHSLLLCQGWLVFGKLQEAREQLELFFETKDLAIELFYDDSIHPYIGKGSVIDLPTTEEELEQNDPNTWTPSVPAPWALECHDRS